MAAVSAVLRDPALQGEEGQPERRRRVRKIIYDTFHFDEMARESLGPTWDRLTPVQQEEFVRLFGNLFEGSYNRLVLRFLGDRQATYDAESIDGDHAVVRTTLTGGKEERLSVEYQLAAKRERWGVVDVRIDGVSLAMNYRAQFTKILRTSSYENLVERMRSKGKS
jgi:phospholipid transport system substrate-binding protein